MDIKYISIITPLLNGEKEILKHLTCLENQVLPRGINLEIIIVDGGSIDNSVDLINTYAKKSNLFIKVYKKPGSSIYEASNYGILKSKGQYLSFLNCDDFFSNNEILSTMYNETQKNSADIIYGNCSFVDFLGKELYKLKVDKKPSILWKFRLFNISHPCALINRKSIEDLKYYDTEFTHVADCDFFIRAYLMGYKFQYLDEDIVRFRLGLTNASKSELAKLDWHKLKEKYLENNILYRFIHYSLLTSLYLRDFKYFKYRFRRFYGNIFNQT